MAKNDLYETLGVKRDAGEKEIRRAFRKLARQYHPDVNPGDKVSEAKFKEINAAYEVLSDPEKRRKYDKYGDRWQYADQIEEMERQRGARPGFNGEGSYSFGDFEDLGNVFESMFGRRGRRTATIRRKGDDAEYPVEVSLEEAYHGTQRILQVQTPQTCPACQGTGMREGAICPTCTGTGTVVQPRRLEVKIPAGVASGSRVRVAGEGQPGMGGGPSGDLYLLVTVLPHPRFERKGDDLHTEVEVPLTDAVLGGEASVPTPKGTKLVLRIPPETQNGRQFRLAGQGMPKLGDPSRKGDLFARVKVVLPTNLTDKERALFEELARSRGGVKVG